MLGGAVALLVIGLVVLVPWHWVPHGTLRPVKESEAFTRAQVARAQARADYVLPRSLLATGLSLALALALAAGPVGRRLRDRWPRRRWVLGVAAATLTYTVLRTALTTPIAWQLRGRALADGLTTQSAGGWWADRLTSTAVSWVGLTIVVLLLIGCARRWPRRWFVPAGLGAAALVVLGSFVTPLVVEPLFNHFTPMPAGPERTALLDLARREGVAVGDVLVADASRRTTTLNAYVSGIGSSKRLVVYDNLLKAAPADEVEAVVAHEIGHAKNHDVLVGTGLGAVGAMAAVAALALVWDTRRRRGATDLGDASAAFALVAALAWGTFVASPLQNAASRAVEARADRESLAATHDAPAFEALQKRLALRSVADPTPWEPAQLWWGTHPTVLQRLGLPASLARAGE
ncbi:M48 family metallopeptidase [Nocardioides marmoribigeumensis]